MTTQIHMIYPLLLNQCDLTIIYIYTSWIKTHICCTWLMEAWHFTYALHICLQTMQLLIKFMTPDRKLPDPGKISVHEILKRMLLISFKFRCSDLCSMFNYNFSQPHLIVLPLYIWFYVTCVGSVVCDTGALDVL